MEPGLPGIGICMGKQRTVCLIIFPMGCEPFAWPAAQECLEPFQIFSKKVLRFLYYYYISIKMDEVISTIYQFNADLFIFDIFS